jgi:hypothetical protein
MVISRVAVIVSGIDVLVDLIYGWIGRGYGELDRFIDFRLHFDVDGVKVGRRQDRLPHRLPH